MRALLNKLAKKFVGTEVEIEVPLEKKPLKIPDMSFVEFLFRKGTKALEMESIERTIKTFVMNILFHRAGVKIEEGKNVGVYFNAPARYPKGFILPLEKSAVEELKKSPTMITIPLLDLEANPKLRATIVDVLREMVIEEMSTNPDLVEALKLDREPLRPQILKKGIFEATPEEKRYLAILSSAIDKVSKALKSDIETFVKGYNQMYPNMVRTMQIPKGLVEISEVFVPDLKKALEGNHPKAVEIAMARVEESFKLERELQRKMLLGEEERPFMGPSL